MTDAVLVGAGPVGMGAIQAALGDGLIVKCSIVVDPDEEKGREAAELIGARGVDSIDALPTSNGGLALATFSSRAELVAPAINQLMAMGYDVITTCEELAFPSSEVAATIRTTAEKEGRRAIVTGANPGFIMDRLPLMLASGVRNVTSIRVTRRLDTKTRRDPLIAKTGKGLSVREFDDRAAAGTIGHVGLEASLRLVAQGLGWPDAPIESSISPVLDNDGSVVGQHQTSTLAAPGRHVEFELTMASNVDTSTDEITIVGEPPIETVVVGGYHGDLGTTARVLSAIKVIRDAAPGFYRPTDLPIEG